MSLTSINSKNIFLKGVTGNVRTAQEDSHDMAALTPNGDVFVVCDGMGGHVGGQEASRIAVESIIEHLKKEKYFNPIRALDEALQFANVQILGYANEHPELKGMGTTACILLLQGDEAYIAHVGDSRIYLYLGKEKQLHRITEDHSWVQMQVKQGLMTEEQAENDPNKNRILKVLGVKPELEPTFNYQNKPIFPKNGDVFLICSDGLSGMISDSTIKSVLSQNITVEQKGDMLIDRALQGENEQPGGQDNITVVLIQIDNSPWKKSEFQSFNPVSRPEYTPPVPVTNPFTGKPALEFKRIIRYIAAAIISLLLVAGGGIATKVLYCDKKLETIKTFAKQKAINGETFYSTIQDFKEEDYKAVCKELEYSMEDAKKVLTQKFQNSKDSTEMQQIINAVTNHSKKSTNK